MDNSERDMILGRLDERTEQLCKAMDNHLSHHERFESQLETRLNELASRSLFTPIKNLFKWIIKIR